MPQTEILKCEPSINNTKVEHLKNEGFFIFSLDKKSVKFQCVRFKTSFLSIGFSLSAQYPVQV
jgi:hypothetical protein